MIKIKCQHFCIGTVCIQRAINQNTYLPMGQGMEISCLATIPYMITLLTFINMFCPIFKNKQINSNSKTIVFIHSSLNLYKHCTSSVHPLPESCLFLKRQYLLIFLSPTHTYTYTAHTLQERTLTAADWL